jgi:hypothetical protein
MMSTCIISPLRFPSVRTSEQITGVESQVTDFRDNDLLLLYDTLTVGLIKLSFTFQQSSIVSK